MCMGRGRVKKIQKVPKRIGVNVSNTVYIVQFGEKYDVVVVGI